jgi:hypothetical protein
MPFAHVQLMELAPFFTTIAGHYRAQFAAFLERQRKAAPRGESEAKLQMRDASPLFRGLHRADYLISSPRQIVFLKPDEAASFEPFSTQVGAMNVEVAEARWDQIVLVCSGGALEENDFLAWFARYFDKEDARRTDGFANAIHSAEIAPGRLSVDFGTAPADALIELLDLLAAKGFTRVRVAAQ